MIALRVVMVLVTSVWQVVETGGLRLYRGGSGSWEEVEYLEDAPFFGHASSIIAKSCHHLLVFKLTNDIARI